VINRSQMNTGTHVQFYPTDTAPPASRQTQLYLGMLGGTVSPIDLITGRPAVGEIAAYGAGEFDSKNRRRDDQGNRLPETSNGVPHPNGINVRPSVRDPAPSALNWRQIRNAGNGVLRDHDRVPAIDVPLAPDLHLLAWREGPAPGLRQPMPARAAAINQGHREEKENTSADPGDSHDAPVIKCSTDAYGRTNATLPRAVASVRRWRATERKAGSGAKRARTVPRRVGSRCTVPIFLPLRMTAYRSSNSQ
jgi:hypothetical protein